jgi:hypothetical protein
MSRPHGRAKVNPTSPRAFAVCERCGFWYNHINLQWQLEYRGTKLANLRKLVCDDCLDVPQPQLKPLVIGPDPVPIMNARPETIVTVTTTVSATYSMLETDQLVSCTGSSSFTVTLPTVVTTPDVATWPVELGDAGKTVTVQANGTGTITIVPLPGQTIQGGPSYVLNPGDEIAMYADTANMDWETIPCLPSTVDGVLELEDGNFLLLEDGDGFLVFEGS